MLHCLSDSLTNLHIFNYCRYSDEEEEEEDSPSVPKDLPVGANLLQPIQVIETTDQDLRMFHRNAKDAEAQKYNNLVRMELASLVVYVPSAKRRSEDGGWSIRRVLEGRGEAWPRAKRDRLTGFEYCQNILLNFTGRVYFKSNNGLSYELDKTHWCTALRLYISLCRCVIDGRAQEEEERRRIDDYIASIHSDEEPIIDTSVAFGNTLVVNENRSKAAVKRLNETREEGLVHPMVAVAALEAEEERFQDDIWEICEDPKLKFANFATPKNIVKALGGDPGDLPDYDIKKYRGCVITDLQELADEMDEEGKSATNILKGMKRTFKAAFCNPKSLRGRGLKDGDVFIFHHDGFFGGPHGKAALPNVKMNRTIFYENGKKRE